MTQLQNYANVILRKFTPQSKEIANYEMRNAVHLRKYKEVQNLILNFPSGLDMSAKEIIADITVAQLKENYEALSKEAPAKKQQVFQ